MRFAEPLARQPDAVFLVGDILRVHEGNIEKAANAWRHFEIETACHRVARNSPRHFVSRKGLGFASEHVPRELVEEKYEGQRAFSAAAPGLQRSTPPRPPAFFETRANGGIEIRIGYKPALR